MFACSDPCGSVSKATSDESARLVYGQILYVNTIRLKVRLTWAKAKRQSLMLKYFLFLMLFPTLSPTKAVLKKAKNG